MALIKMNFNSRKGLSLPELLIGITLVSFVSIAIYSVFFAQQRIYFNQSALIEAETQNKLAMDEITRYAREAVGFANEDISWNDYNILSFKLLPISPTTENPYYNGIDYDNAIFKHDSVNKTLIEYGETNNNSSETSRPLMQKCIDSDCPNPPRIFATGVTAFNITYPPGVDTEQEYLNASWASITITTEAKTVFGKIFTSTKTATIYLKK